MSELVDLAEKYLVQDKKIELLREEIQKLEVSLEFKGASWDMHYSAAARVVKCFKENFNNGTNR